MEKCVVIEKNESIPCFEIRSALYKLPRDLDPRNDHDGILEIQWNWGFTV